MPMPSSSQAASSTGIEVGEAEQREPRGQRQIGDRQHRAAADQIDLPADARAEQGGDHQRGGERGKNPVRGNAEIARDRIGQDRRQIIARGPGQRLRGAEREDDRKLARVHGCGVSLLDQIQRHRAEQDARRQHRERRHPGAGARGPPAASSATPTAQAPSADRLKPTVECTAMVAPRYLGVAPPSTCPRSTRRSRPAP